MNRIWWNLSMLFLTLGALSCGNDSAYSIINNGIEILLPSQKAVRVTFMAEDIVKVEASADAKFDESKSLIEVVDAGKIDFDVSEEGQFIKMKSDELIVI